MRMKEITMLLNKKQEDGLKLAVDRYLNQEKFTVISGYAGTGKSTLVRFIIEALPNRGPSDQRGRCSICHIHRQSRTGAS